MARGKKHTAEQIVTLLREIEVATANGKAIAAACRESGITEQTFQDGLAGRDPLDAEYDFLHRTVMAVSNESTLIELLAAALQFDAERIPPNSWSHVELSEAEIFAMGLGCRATFTSHAPEAHASVSHRNKAFVQ